MARGETVWKREQPPRGRFAEHNVLRREGEPTTLIKSRANTITDVVFMNYLDIIALKTS